MICPDSTNAPHPTLEAAVVSRQNHRILSALRGCIGRTSVALGAMLAFVGCGRKQEASPTASTPASLGAQVYEQYCAICHMPEGEGVPNFQPPLRGSEIVAGDSAKLEAVIRAGSAALRDREPLYSTEMPPFGMLSEDEVKAVLAYVREHFGATASGSAP